MAISIEILNVSFALCKNLYFVIYISFNIDSFT